MIRDKYEARKRRLYTDLVTSLPSLPETFEHGAIWRAIGYEPDRVALYRLLRELVRDGALRVQVRGEGRKASKYRRA